tara:strand:- start:20949 stop:21785 length:837 start_codon:yes stop_codon:yes gene_type:complete
MAVNKFGGINRFFIRKNDEKSDLESTRGQVRSLVKKAGLSYTDRIMLDNVINFSSTEVSEAMVPRANIVSVSIESSLKDCIEVFKKAAHSRLPVYKNTLDEIIGMVHVKDILAYWEHEDSFELNKIIRKVIISTPSTSISELFQEMRSTKIHLSIVVDEHGGTDGLITIEDLVEEITGEIEDEHDISYNLILDGNSDGSVIVDARIAVLELEKHYNCKLLTSSMEVDTLGGLLFNLENSVPEKGKIIKHDSGLIFEIIEADLRRIKKIKIIGSPNIKI